MEQVRITKSNEFGQQELVFLGLAWDRFFGIIEEKNNRDAAICLKSKRRFLLHNK